MSIRISKEKVATYIIYRVGSKVYLILSLLGGSIQNVCYAAIDFRVVIRPTFIINAHTTWKQSQVWYYPSRASTSSRLLAKDIKLLTMVFLYGKTVEKIDIFYFPQTRFPHVPVIQKISLSEVPDAGTMISVLALLAPG